MIKALYFVRHGHYRPKEAPTGKYSVLTLTGLEDIVELGQKLQKIDKNIETIYTSPYKRTQETASLLSRFTHASIVVRDELQEQYSLDAKVAHFKDIYSKVDLVVNEALDNREGTCIIVSHELPISLYISKASGVTFEEISKDPKHRELLLMGECIHTTFSNKELLHYEKI